mmetsp:Transcript_32633/g.59641  ORF Transcript_32633/g.59641 Transcript_32633/m.59641 type:complete len:395 (-) Transcript_32633:72-1256(-)
MADSVVSKNGNSHGNLLCSDASLTVMVAAALLLTGLLGIPSYIVSCCLPTPVLVCLLFIAAGAALAVSEVYLDDRVFFGVSISELVASSLVSYRDGWSRFMVLMSMTPDDIKAKDVELLVGRSRPLTAPLAAPSPAIEAMRTQVAFHAAVQWLRRPSLTLSYECQKRLQSLYKEAMAERSRNQQRETNALADASQPTPHAPQTNGVHRMVNGNALNGHATAVARSCTEEKEAIAPRRLLPAVLAEADPAFATANPGLRIAPVPYSQPSTLSHLSLAIRLLLQRLPADLDDKVLAIHQRLFQASLLQLAGIHFCTPRRLRAPRWMALICTLYFAALSRGVPKWLYELFKRLGSRQQQQCLPARTAPPGAIEMLKDLVVRVAVPRVSPPLMARETQ